MTQHHFGNSGMAGKNQLPVRLEEGLRQRQNFREDVLLALAVNLTRLYSAMTCSIKALVLFTKELVRAASEFEFRAMLSHEFDLLLRMNSMN
jgi:hypothetical protein